MALREYLETLPHYPVVTYDGVTDYLKTGVSFVGTVRKHPYDKTKIILVSLLDDANSCFFEFKLDDVIHAEDRPQLVSERGETLQRIEIWLRKGAFGIRMEPFVVGENGNAGVDTNDLYR